MEEIDRFDEREWDSLAELRSAFEWEIPDSLNATRLLCDRWADGDGRPAVRYEDETADRSGTLTFTDLSAATGRLAGHLRAEGVGTGDFVAVNVPQKPETVLAHLAAWRLGAVSVPLSVLLGPDALEHVLSETRPAVGVVDTANLEAFRTAADRVGAPDTRFVVGGGDHRANESPFQAMVESADRVTGTADTASDDPMLAIYTSGTTGPPKGILQPHRTVPAHVPGAVANFYNLEFRGDEIWWTPSEWAWGASLSLIIDALYFGRPVVASESGESFDPGRALGVLERYDITHALVPPSALRMVRSRARTAGGDRTFPRVRLVVSGGESLDAPTHRWARTYFNATVHEGYGASEMFDHIIGDCTALEPTTYGPIGYPLPGHNVRLLDPETGEPVGTGEVGEIVLHRDDPVLFLGYLDRPDATAESFRGEWYRSGDLATRNEAGQFTFVGRRDDLIISSGYRIAPGTVEASLPDHEAVAAAAVVGVSHDERGEVPKAFVKPAPGFEPDDDLRDALQQHVRERLSAYEYPRQVEFVEDLPRTTTGKIKRSALADHGPTTDG